LNLRGKWAKKLQYYTYEARVWVYLTTTYRAYKYPKTLTSTTTICRSKGGENENENA